VPIGTHGRERVKGRKSKNDYGQNSKKSFHSSCDILKYSKIEHVPVLYVHFIKNIIKFSCTQDILMALFLPNKQLFTNFITSNHA